MKKILLVAIFLLAFPCLLRAQDGTKTFIESISPTSRKSEEDSFFKDTHFSIINTVQSRYWGSIVGGIFYTGGPVNFTDLKYTIDDKYGSTYFLIGMINPLDTTRYDYNGGTEYYASVGRTFDLWRGGPKNLPTVRITAALLYDAISQVERISDDVLQEYLRIDFPRVPFTQPYVEGYHWDKIGRNSPPVGFFGRAGIHRQQPLGFKVLKSDMELGLDLSIGVASEGLFGTSAGLAYYRAVVSTEFKITKHFSILPSIVGQLPGNGQDDGRKFVDHSRLFYNATLRWDF